MSSIPPTALYTENWSWKITELASPTPSEETNCFFLSTDNPSHYESLTGDTPKTFSIYNKRDILPNDIINKIVDFIKIRGTTGISTGSLYEKDGVKINVYHYSENFSKIISFNLPCNENCLVKFTIAPHMLSDDNFTDKNDKVEKFKLFAIYFINQMTLDCASKINGDKLHDEKLREGATIRYRVLNAITATSREDVCSALFSTLVNDPIEPTKQSTFVDKPWKSGSDFRRK